MAPLLLVIDYWEKLAGASLALSAIIRLCQTVKLSLVAPTVHSSLFLPSGGLPLSSYYDTTALGAALAPQVVVPYGAWRRLRRESTDRSNNASINVAIIYHDFPSACIDALSSERTLCPSTCLAATGVRRLVAGAQRWLTHDRAPWHCVRAVELRNAIQGGGGVFAELLSRSSAVALLNFRRHDSGKPMLSPTQGLALRASAVRPSPAVRAAARRFLETHRMPSTYGLVQLRSNHLAHSSFVATGGSVSSSATPQRRNCTRRLGACVRRLGRAARRLAPPAATVVASDLVTLFDANQDGATHARHPYMRECLLPSLPALRRWHASAGRAFGRNCTSPTAGHGMVKRSTRSRNASTALGCDAGFLGLVDLVLATEADAFVAVDVKQPWRSAFLEWIVQSRRLRGRSRTELVSC